MGDALYAATVWGFESARTSILKNMPPDMLCTQRILLGTRCRVPAWLVSGLEELCRRREPLRQNEIEVLGYSRAAAVGRVREWMATSGTEGSARARADVRYCMSKEPGLWSSPPRIQIKEPLQTSGLRKHNSFYMEDQKLLTFKVRVLALPKIVAMPS